MRLLSVLILSFAMTALSSFADTATPSPTEIAKMAEEETSKVFNADYKAKIQRESNEKFPDVNIGDKITIPLRFGGSFVDKTGVLKAVDRDQIMVNFGDATDRKIVKREIPAELFAAIYGENKELRASYFQKSFTQARASFKKAATDRLFHENGYVFDQDMMRWTPKLKAEPEKVASSDSDSSTITTLNGEIYYNVVVHKVNSDSLEILHSKGATTIPLDKLPERTRRLFAGSAAVAAAPSATNQEQASESTDSSSKNDSSDSSSPSWSESKPKKPSTVYDDAPDRSEAAIKRKEADFNAKANKLMMSKALFHVKFKVVEAKPDYALCVLLNNNTSPQPDYFVLVSAGSKTIADFEVYTYDLFWTGTMTFSSKSLKRDFTLNAYSHNKDYAQKEVRKNFELFDKDSPGFGGESGSDANGSAKADDDNESAKAAIKSGIKAFGSGFIITQDGYMVTNYHVVKGASKISVKLDGKRTVSAKLVAKDPDNDLALVKADGKFTPISIASDKIAKPGQTVFAIGFPTPTALGYTPKITKGVISAVNGFNDDIRFYQVDTSIQPGNSGGPLADEYGNLLGIIAASVNPAYFKNITAGSLPQNVNYAIKKSYLLAFVENLSEINGKLVFSKDDRQMPLEDAVAKVQMSTVQIIIY